MNAQLVTWLQGLGCFNVRPISVTIGDQTWEAAAYWQTFTYTAGMDCVVRGEKKAGDNYSEEAIYCLGKLPKCYKHNKRNRICFPHPDGREWYVSGYLPAPVDDERMKQYHPFGIYFMLRPWPFEEKIDKYDSKPYTRVNMTVIP